MQVEESIRKAIGGRLAEIGLDLVDVRYRPGKNASLTIVVDRVEPISLEDIVHISEKVSAWLDEDDPIKEAYTLDVSSLGAEKPIQIEKIDAYVGKFVHLHLDHAVNGLNILEGKLLESNGEEILLQIKIKTRRKELKIRKDNITKARLAIEF